MKNYLKLISLSFLLLAASCSETSSDTVLQTSDNSNRSTKSVKLPVISIAAEIEQSNYPATNAIDNDFTSRWSGFGGSANLDLDLGSVNEIDFLFEKIDNVWQFLKKGVVAKMYTLINLFQIIE